MRLHHVSTCVLHRQRGSALVLAILVLALLAGMGTALLFLSETEERMSEASLRPKKAFYLAEAGLETAREVLYALNRSAEFSDDLADGSGGGAAGPDGELEFDPEALIAQWGSDGTLAALSGFGDDIPLRGLTAIEDGWYAAFLTNDPLDGEHQEVDSNERVMITGVGIARDRSLEVVQAIVEKVSALPTVPPATITLLGPAPEFYGGTSKAKAYSGDDCGSAGGMYVPVVGTIGDDAEAAAEGGVDPNPVYESGPLPEEDTIANLNDPDEPAVVGSGLGTLGEQWQDCEQIRDLIESVRSIADTACCTEPAVCPTVDDCPFPATSPAHILFVDGDYEIDHSRSGQGVLLVTGVLRFHGSASWEGLVLAFGQGVFDRYGAGNGVILGGSMAADVAGPDDLYGTDDDCTGPDEGFSPVLYDERGGGSSDTIYCSTVLALSDPVLPYEIMEFLQR